MSKNIRNISRALLLSGHASAAPNLYSKVSSLKKINLSNYPVGHVTCFNTPTRMAVDVTGAVQDAKKNNRTHLNFILIRELYRPQENTDAYQALLSSRESSRKQAPKLYIFK